MCLHVGFQQSCLAISALLDSFMPLLPLLVACLAQGSLPTQFCCVVRFILFLTTARHSHDVRMGLWLFEAHSVAGRSAQLVYVPCISFD